MPLYTYKCKSCAYTYEKRKRFDEENDTVCPECGQEVRRVVNSIGIVFKGSGFYVTDNRGQASSRNANNGVNTKEEKTDRSETAETVKSEENAPKTETKSAEPSSPPPPPAQTTTPSS